MKIGELAKAAGTQAETVRYYEREGLLPEPARTGSNYRSYGESHLARLSFIRACRALDMTLDEIRALLRFKEAPAENCRAVDTLIDEHARHVAERIRELEALQAELKALRARCDEACASCGILESLDKRRPGAAAHGKAKAHVGGAHGRNRPA
jgi:Cd(II)/Pb(II)-responsive transcriptional regulator